MSCSALFFWNILRTNSRRILLLIGLLILLGQLQSVLDFIFMSCKKEKVAIRLLNMLKVWWRYIMFCMMEGHYASFHLRFKYHELMTVTALWMPCFFSGIVVLDFPKYILGEAPKRFSFEAKRQSKRVWVTLEAVLTF